MPTERKSKAIDEIKGYLKDNQNIIITDYRGLNVTEISGLRNKLREQNITYKIVKNTLTRIVVDDLKLSDTKTYLTGPSAIAFNIEDPVQAAKLFQDFIKGRKNFEIKGGLLDGKIISADQISALAKLPSREALLSKLLGTMNAPVTAFVRVINAPAQGLVTVLDRIKESKAAEAA